MPPGRLRPGIQRESFCGGRLRGQDERMRRVVILGRGGAGKSVLARQLSGLTGIPAIELDGLFWQPGAEPTPAQVWVVRHRELIAGERWIIDGDLGPYDALPSRRGWLPRTGSSSLTSASCAARGGPCGGVVSRPNTGAGSGLTGGRACLGSASPSPRTCPAPRSTCCATRQWSGGSSRRWAARPNRPALGATEPPRSRSPPCGRTRPPYSCSWPSRSSRSAHQPPAASRAGAAQP